MDPLDPIPPSAPPYPSRRVPAVDRLRRITREGDRPRRVPPEHRPSGQEEPPRGEGEDGGEGRIDVRV